MRLGGTRAFDGITVDDAGEIVLPEPVLDEIARFDLGTDATVRAIGSNEQGGTHVALRIVPLDPVAPWWTIWIVVAATLVMLWRRRRGSIETRDAKLVAALVLVASAIPAVVLGWRATTTVVTWWGIAAALIGIVLTAAIRRADAPEQAEVDPR